MAAKLSNGGATQANEGRYSGGRGQGESQMKSKQEEVTPSGEQPKVTFPAPSKHPKGLLNEYACGCQVRRDASGGHFIHACPLHNAAPALYEALENLYGDLYLLGMNEITLEQIYSGSFKEALETLVLARGKHAEVAAMRSIGTDVQASGSV
jgi:hypothetical protein